MRPVTRYQADDGAEFYTAEQATDHDALVARIAAINTMLKRPRLSHGTYYQHDHADYWAWRRAVVELVREHHPDTLKDTPAEQFSPWGYVGRFLSDAGGPLNRLWARLMCTTDDAREYDQPYFTRHPHEARPCSTN
jgi:hypothetical protein